MKTKSYKFNLSKMAEQFNTIQLVYIKTKSGNKDAQNPRPITMIGMGHMVQFKCKELGYRWMVNNVIRDIDGYISTDDGFMKYTESLESFKTNEGEEIGMVEFFNLEPTPMMNIRMPRSVFLHVRATEKTNGDAKNGIKFDEWEVLDD